VRPRIRYCVTPAGRVAYSTVGAGPALMCDSGWITDLRAQLELFSFGGFIERLAERFTVIRFDKPGCGLSGPGGGRSVVRRAGGRGAGGGRRGGRYLLGLGASTKALAEGFHDTAFEHPAAKLRDVVTKVRALLAGQPA
jgi:pimeloyl-ACP methyl ester carboxylesterase